MLVVGSVAVSVAAIALLDDQERQALLCAAGGASLTVWAVARLCLPQRAPTG